MDWTFLPSPVSSGSDPVLVDGTVHPSTVSSSGGLVLVMKRPVNQHKATLGPFSLLRFLWTLSSMFTYFSFLLSRPDVAL